MELRKKINITLKDYFFFNIGLVKKTIITYVIVLVVVCIAFNGIMNGFKLNEINFWLNSLLFYIVGLVVLLGYFFLLVFLASKKAYTPNKKYYENMEIVINDQGIFQYSDGAESGLTYNQIFKVKENRLALIILISDRQGILIPKKGFSKEEIEEVKKLINNHKGG